MDAVKWNNAVRLVSIGLYIILTWNELVLADSIVGPSVLNRVLRLKAKMSAPLSGRAPCWPRLFMVRPCVLLNSTQTVCMHS